MKTAQKQQIQNRFSQMLTPFQVFSLQSTASLSLLIWFFPRTAVKFAEFDAQWSVLVIVVISIGLALLHGLLNERFPNMFGPDWVFKLYGNWLGISINMIYVILYIVFVGIATRVYIDVLHSLFWQHTPIFMLTIALFITSIIGAHYGIEVLARVTSIIHPLTWFGFTATFLVGLLQIPHSEWYGIPLQVDQWSHVFRGTHYLMPLLFGMNFHLMLSPYYRHTKRSVWLPVLSAGAGSIIVILGFMVPALIIGWEQIKHILWTIPYVFRLVRLEGFFIERVGLSVIILATVFNILFTSSHLWAISTLCARIFKKSDDRFKSYLLYITIIICIVALLPKNNEQIKYVIETWLAPCSWLSLLIIPLVSYCLALIRGMKGTDEEKAA